MTEDEEGEDLLDLGRHPLGLGGQPLRERPQVVPPLVLLEDLAQHLPVLPHLLEGGGEEVQPLLLRGQVEVTCKIVNNSLIEESNYILDFI